jgi:hypothetical protein
LSATQDIGRERFTCTFKVRTIAKAVNNGTGRINYGGTMRSGNIASNGKFRIELPTENRFKKSNGDNDVKNRITYIFQGYLAESGASGLFTSGKEDLNNAGCSTKLVITKI